MPTLSNVGKVGGIQVKIKSRYVMNIYKADCLCLKIPIIERKATVVNKIKM